MISVEASRGKMLSCGQEVIQEEITSGRGVAIFNDEKPVSFARCWEYEDCVEIGSVVTDPAKRGRGYAQMAATQVIFWSQETKNKPLIAFTNPESFGLFHKLGFRERPKNEGSSELWIPCRDCQEVGNWPKCHCHFMRLDGKLFKTEGCLYAIIQLNDRDDILSAASVYCKVWQEPPWNEHNWHLVEVSRYLASIGRDKNGISLVAATKKRIAGFTAGWPMVEDQMTSQVGLPLPWLFTDGRPIFYIAELATNSDFRGQGIGRQLSLQLINAAKDAGYNRFALRTHLLAGQARKLYTSLGFHETRITDHTYPDRSYWVRVDG